MAPDRRRKSLACREFARVVRPGGWLLAAFHVDSPDFAAGQVNHLTTWFGEAVELDRSPGAKNERATLPRR